MANVNIGGLLAAVAVAVAVALALSAGAARADIEFMGEMTYGPKRSPGGALVGEIAAPTQAPPEASPRREKAASSAIRMADAAVDIFVGAYPRTPDAVTAIRGKAVFTMENEGDTDARVVIGFPLGERRYSNYRFRSFAARVQGRPVPVFAGSGGYKRPWDLVPAAPGATDPVPAIAKEKMSKGFFKGVWIGGKRVMKLVLWEASFPARETRTVEVDYVIDVPWQYPDMIRRNIQGSFKAEQLFADSITPALAKALESKKSYLFFDYVLATGASWKGPIGKEVVRIHLDPSWGKREPRLFVAPRQERQGFRWEEKAGEASLRGWETDAEGKRSVVFEKSGFEPTAKDDLFFALEFRYR